MILKHFTEKKRKEKENTITEDDTEKSFCIVLYNNCLHCSSRFMGL